MIIADIETICFAKLIKTFEYHLEIVVFFVKRLQFYKKQYQNYLKVIIKIKN